MIKRNEHRKTIGILILLTLSIFILSMNVGVVKLSPLEVIKVLLGQGDGFQNIVLWDIRLPRACVAAVVGVSLGIAGTVMQGVTGNEIATPGMLGITSGASLGVLASIYLNSLFPELTRLAAPVCAMLGGLFVFAIVYTLSLTSNLSPAKLILNGIAINSCIGAFTVLLVYRLSPSETTYINIVLTGSITGANFKDLWIALPFIGFGLFCLFYKIRCLNILTLGEEISIGLGVDLLKERKMFLCLAVLLASISSFLVGGLNFVGLLSSHIARKLVGNNYEKLVPTSALVGVVVMLLSDMLARTLFVPSELPIGSMVSLLGTPYLMYILLKTDR